MAALSWILVIVAWLRDKLRTGWQILLLAFLLRRHPVHYRQPKSCAEKKHYYHYSRKPEWVKRKIIYLKARYPYMGCRTLANLFNQIYTEKRKMTVGKTYISRVIQQHRYEIQVLRRRIKNRKPKPQSKNLIWGIDLTQVRDTNNQPHTLLGIIDHGTRACVALERIPDKTSFTLLRFICDMAERYGKPKIIRTDNESVFTSRLFRLGLWLMRIKHQRTEKHCPWQNGYIERFFGTLKAAICKIAIAHNELPQRLLEFRFHYNHVRPHQNLNGKIPAQVWGGYRPHAATKGHWISLWGDVLSGYYLLPD